MSHGPEHQPFESVARFKGIVPFINLVASYLGHTQILQNQIGTV